MTQDEPAATQTASDDAEVVLSVRGLTTAFRTEAGVIRPVDDVSLDLKRGRTLALVGESGSGKSVTSLSILRLIPEATGCIERGQILFQGKDVLALSKDELRSYRGNRVAMIFQEPMTALNPVQTAGKQIAEVFKLHKKLDRKAAWEAAVGMLRTVKIPDPEARASQYPHELSGGMRQRVMIAMALACGPAVLIADEPTTALDVTIQAQVLELMRELQRELGTAVLFITHDLGVVAEIADDVAVMYAGRIVEQGRVIDVLERPLHPYTRGLMRARPSLAGERSARLPIIEGIVPSLHALPAGCRFVDRCPLAEASCRAREPRLEKTDQPGHLVACPVTLRSESRSEGAHP